MNKEKYRVCIVADYNKGITLVALVITIIVLLILAGITINLTVGQRGILTRAQKAGKNYQEAAKREDEDLAKFIGEADNIIAGLNVLTGDKYTMTEGVPVPKGFEHVEGTKETGFVIKDISGTETNGNEFVWVPCNEDGMSGIKYDRHAFGDLVVDGIDKVTNSTKIKYSLSSSDYFTEVMPTEELNSIKKYGGFYIGRYEVGIEGYDEDLKTTNIGADKIWTRYVGGKAVVQKGKQVWNYITRDKAKEIAEGMYSSNNVVIGKLCSSYAWDTALEFIETKVADYPTNSIQGNYHDTTFTYIDLKGNTQMKNRNTDVLVPTGQTTSVNNIYDMGGNVWELTTEAYSSTGYICVLRSGCYNNGAGSYPAANRYVVDATGADEARGFRIALYIRI